MAIPIKAIPTLYGAEAERLRISIERADEAFAAQPVVDIKQSAYYKKMKEFLAKSEAHKW